MRVSKEANVHESTVLRLGTPPEPKPKPRKRKTDPRLAAALKLAGGDRSRIKRQPDGSYIFKAPGYAD